MINQMAKVSLRRNFIRRVILVLIVLLLTLTFVFVLDQQFQIKPQISFSHHRVETDPSPWTDYTPQLYQPLSSSVTRAVAIFYPNDQEDHFYPELLWLFRSWVEMMEDEPMFWRTDLVIYTGSFTSRLENLGCLFNYIRVDRYEPARCRVFHYERISQRDLSRKTNQTHPYRQIDEKLSRLITYHLRTYSYADSINIMAECYPSFAMYDYILRSDSDVFLTKYFAFYVPANGTFLVGQGGYSAPFNTARLKRIAKNMNWSHANLTNIGSTWYGSPIMTQQTANLTLYAMAYLAENEFTRPEREGKLGVMLWPEWHYGVLLLYGSHLAINHLVLREHFKLGLAYGLLDQSVTSRDQTDMERNHRLHLHCWHGEDQFSKFAFKDGKYNHISPSQFANDTSSSGYAMRMALESRRMSPAELRVRLINAKTTYNSSQHL